jgi:hypothetical protein
MRARKLNPRRWTLARPGRGRAGRASTKGGYASGVAATALLAAVGMALLVWLVVVPATRVQAATYTVNVTTDVDDLAIDGICDSDAAGGDQCSLRAAIQEANASVDDDVIAIGVTGPIVLVGGLPAITDGDLIITGSDQQVSLTAPAIAFNIKADGVQINNLVIDGENVGTIGIQISVTTDDVVLDGLTVRGFTDDGFDNSPGGGGKRNTIRGSTFTANGGSGIDFNGGEDDELHDSVITNNGDVAGDNGLEIANDDDFLIQGNTFSGNFDAQIMIDDMAAGQHLSIVQNSITSGSDGVVIGAPVDLTAAIDIGLSDSNRNVFRGAIAAPAEQHLRNLSAANVNAIYNDWDAYSPAAIEGVICHKAEAGCGTGIVDFEPFVDVPSPLPTATPLATATQTPGGATATPTVTPTGTPGGVQTVGLIAGCNPEAWTGSDNTPVATIGSAVSPASVLISIWAFQAGTWLGYSQLYPEASQTFNVARLGVVFICVSTPGTFSRPLI